MFVGMLYYNRIVFGVLKILNLEMYIKGKQLTWIRRIFKSS
jgi:hypothetical protein